ncbi:Peptidyl-prolyl cis-trans isomerase FKBP53 [Dendrobium catenatum]|uniref:peptidylprolyl isomerase n=1 Tax=Dendrobium catenatum TaxID=906689 RepID=A0A2I0VW96_9ASPA|nr:Peptidyl-prolyl cis-trans isomerase FKBP53 [Dendrobium catenatum]
MAFWGVEIRPSKPYIHNFDQSRGRLRISQATLGDGKSTSRSTMQCNVGDKSPVLLCSLIPNVSETCHLELEFEEDGEVIFSVLGQRSIHLTGYYLGHGRSLDGDDTESYGEDIAESDASDSYSYGSEDDYESDFIDDADVAIYSESRRPKSSVVIEEIEDDEKQHRNFRRLKKKHEISDSEDVEMGSQQLVVRNKGSTKEESEDDDGFPICFTEEGTISKKKKSDDKKRKVNGSTQDTVSVSKANTDRDSRMPAETASKHNEKSKKKKENDEKRSIGSENEEKQNKHKENVNVENNSETDTNLSKEIEGHAKESLNGVKDTDKSGDPDACKQSKKKSKKRRISEGASDEQDSFMEDIDADKIPKEDKMTVDEPAATDVNVTKKKKKSKKKNKDSDIKHEALAKEKADLAVNGVDELKQGSQAIKTRTFPNGLIVEEVSMGKPDGKKASPGKKALVKLSRDGI